MLRISCFLCVALATFFTTAKTADANLINQLNDLSKQYSVALIYNKSLIKGLSVTTPGTAKSLEQTLNAWLTAHQLSWKKTSAGIVIYKAKTSATVTKNKTRLLEEVMVTEQLPRTFDQDDYNNHYQRALERSQQLKKGNIGQSEYAVGAMLTQLPAENLAESLQAVPGLSITRERAEALNINAMGLGAQYQLTLFNGHRLANTENVRNSNQYGQQYRFDIVSAGLFSNIAVYKTSEPSLPSGAIGATIDLLSDDPLALKNNNLQAKLSTSALAGEPHLQPSFTLSANATTPDDEIGVIVKINYENRIHQQSQFESWHWGENSGAPEPYQWPNINDNTLVPSDGLALTIENEKRTRASYYGSLAWQAAKRFKINTLWFSSDSDFSFNEDRLSINPQSQSANAFVNNKNSLNQFIFNEVNAKTSKEESNLSYKNQTLQLEADWQPFKQLPLTVLPFYSQSRAISNTQTPISRVHVGISPMQANVGLQTDHVNNFDFSGNLGLVSSYSHVNQMSKRTIKVLNQVNEWGLDTHWRPKDKWHLHQLSAGFLQSTQRYDYKRRDISLSANALQQLPNLDGRWLTPIKNHFSAQFIAQDVQPWMVPKSNLFQLYNINLSIDEVSDNDRLNSYKVKFVSNEGYLRALWQFNQIALNTGLRYSKTASDSYGAKRINDNVIPVNNNQTDHAWLPSVNIKWQPLANWQWRAGFSRSINRPNYSDLNPKLHLNSGGLPYAELGNPHLKSVSAHTRVISVNWQQPNVNTQLLGFNHTLKNFIVEHATTLNVQGLQYTSLQRTNNGTAHINGLQASSQWQLPLFSPWYLQSQLSASMTHINKADVSTLAGNHFKVEGVSDWAGNLRFLVRDDKWQAAFNINYRSDFSEQRDITNNASSYVEAYTSTDLSFSWLYSANATLRLDIFNATDELLTHTAKTPHAQSLLKVEEFGRRFVLSLALKI